METMYLSKENGGLSNVTLLPYLEGLMKDKENTVTFSNLNDKFGGHITLKRSSFTVAATVGTICGYPYLDESFYEKMHCLPSILHDFGYELHMIKGTSITDWGVGRMFAAHHFDNLTLKDDIVPNTKENWLNDHLTWMKYREDLDKLGKLNKPFYSHFFTLDSHEPGMKCPYCPKDGTVQENAVRCVDNHVKSFMEWAKDQSWYNNTLFVLVGDHLVRGFGYKERAEANHYSRRSVNIFYHSEIKPLKATNREYSILDYFPTILAAAGFKIKKDQLGVGVNLFSNKKTKLEEYGLDTLQTNLESTIKFYNEIVLGKPKECRFNEPCIDVKITQMI
ncbi:hypothetical protein TVAG_364040 [Trichomonas vaginalis G3]|uniref:Sulfatase N-terminal domain-containing protein n=1 Tax=Trichomonas vaginalis (strain ATCC PRA-98 / G3) TaxID=412133 RepID=A2EDX3_TRIV3|nr:lipoteichoic acid synthase family [Trichomonas vaginalis G3]EAY09189.1 hypothetical protein TVAG_364040 [Trichomonas vaginalis G3]KAI5487024.1 lipoteichoic acid synthase family [Trichomonas vaginalis G3]|eukprot:XP_001321412.1 hypothetical protein [Trichomonas vaginalis G3]